VERQTVVRGILVLLLVAVVASPAALAFIRQWEPDLILRGPGVTRMGKLSEYFAGSRGHPTIPTTICLRGQRRAAR